MARELRIEIGGEPLAQGRMRMAVVKGQARGFDPPKSRSWKADAKTILRDAMRAAGLSLFDGPVAVIFETRFTSPRSKDRKRDPRPERWHPQRPDVDNLLKAMMDACKGIVWRDDSQVALNMQPKLFSAQGEPPLTVFRVVALERDWNREWFEAAVEMALNGPATGPTEADIDREEWLDACRRQGTLFDR